MIGYLFTVTYWQNNCYDQSAEYGRKSSKKKKITNVVIIKRMICPIFVDVILRSLTRNFYFGTCSFKADMFCGKLKKSSCLMKLNPKFTLSGLLRDSSSNVTSKKSTCAHGLFFPIPVQSGTIGFISGRISWGASTRTQDFLNNL